MGAGRNVLRQPRVRLRRRAVAAPAGAGRTSRSSPPTSSRRRRARRPTGSPRPSSFNVNGVEVGVIGAGLREHAGARERRCDRGPGVPAGGRADRRRIGTAARGGRQGAGGRHPPGHRARLERRRRQRRGAVGRADHRHRRRVGRHHRRRHDRRSHPPRLQPDGRRHPRRRGHQRRDELLGAAAHGGGRTTWHGPAARPGSPRRSA